MGYAKLAAAIGALAVAINAYTDLQKENLDLAKENRVLFQAVATKVNSMAEELAYMRGRVDGMRPEEAERAAEEKITVIEPTAPANKPKPSSRGKKTGMSKPRKAASTPKRPPAQQRAPALKVDAYEQLPEDLGELIELEQQAQEKSSES
jgi:hypothetical protein